ncbi:DMT family transporter [Achromobacter ruhlandii]|uniref:DMT family transporter n=1 Tax=Achromobacter ruhlandii TaxID=72557 RepID=UPI0006C7034D|nr:multidrug efflux SMR transporter [Achromobacter ruhlandii]AMG44521.1 QacE family quaternary ammonium compound efflux SMR transporter [Achromobacter xylosoxidans]CUJ18974.1 Quaternary ammonium compound-resistance protein sugE [Achromobacter ruhlandii]CUJ32981.1 Quaternary ammonium compound-resistance protein sugE [Achromobacter ruhlandii]CUJ93022.1 Quaternary ammonium compound-resistance protein sugE [Achromobacter ruhlandii]
MAWWILLAASGVEIVMALALKYADGWTRFWPSAIGIAAALGSIFLLTLAMRHLPAGTAYAVWTGIGSVGITVLGIVLFGDSPSVARLTCIALIVGGVAGLKLLEA